MQKTLGNNNHFVSKELTFMLSNFHTKHASWFQTIMHFCCCQLLSLSYVFLTDINMYGMGEEGGEEVSVLFERSFFPSSHITLFCFCDMVFTVN